MVMRFTEYEIEIVMQVHDRISTDFKRRNSVADLVAQFDISESALTKGFKFIYNKPLCRCRLEKTMGYARKMLEQGSQVKVIAIELNYKTTGSFIRAFKKVFYHPPGTFIQQSLQPNGENIKQ
jgi:AraC-like DNA-binding protein